MSESHPENNFNGNVQEINQVNACNDERVQVVVPATSGPTSRDGEGGKKSRSRKGKRHASNYVASPAKVKSKNKTSPQTTPTKSQTGDQTIPYTYAANVPPQDSFPRQQLFLQPPAYSPYPPASMGTAYTGQIPLDFPPSYDEATAGDNCQPSMSQSGVSSCSQQSAYISLSQLGVQANVSESPSAPITSQRPSRPGAATATSTSRSTHYRETPSNSPGAPSQRQQPQSLPTQHCMPSHANQDQTRRQESGSVSLDNLGPLHGQAQQYVSLDNVNIPQNLNSLDLGQQGGAAQNHVQQGVPAQPPDQYVPIPISPQGTQGEVTITVAQCHQRRGDQPIKEVIYAYVIEMEAEQPVHALVKQARRKLCVGDATGVMVGYIKRKLAVGFIKGDSVRLRNITWRDNYFLIHGGTVASTTEDVVVNEDIKRRGTNEYFRPQTPLSTVAHSVRGTKGQVFTIHGKVITTESARVVGKDKDSLVKTITVRDATGEVKCSLWGSAANKCEINLGQQITLNDASAYWSGRQACVMLNVNESDQVILGPPQDLQEEIDVYGVEETERYNTVLLDASSGQSNERLTIDRYYLSGVFSTVGNISVRQLVRYIPFKCKVNLTGQHITAMTNVRVSMRVAQRLTTQNQPRTPRTPQPRPCVSTSQTPTRMQTSAQTQRHSSGGSQLQSPGTTHMQSPAATHMQSPATTHMQSPAATHMQSPATTHMQSPAPTQMQSPPSTQMHTPGASQMQTPAASPMQTPGASHMQTPAGSQRQGAFVGTQQIQNPQFAPQTHVSSGTPQNTAPRTPAARSLAESLQAVSHSASNPDILVVHDDSDSKDSEGPDSMPDTAENDVHMMDGNDDESLDIGTLPTDKDTNDADSVDDKCLLSDEDIPSGQKM